MGSSSTAWSSSTAGSHFSIQWAHYSRAAVTGDPRFTDHIHKRICWFRFNVVCTSIKMRAHWAQHSFTLDPQRQHLTLRVLIGKVRNKEHSGPSRIGTLSMLFYAELIHFRKPRTDFYQNNHAIILLETNNMESKRNKQLRRRRISACESRLQMADCSWLRYESNMFTDSKNVFPPWWDNWKLFLFNITRNHNCQFPLKSLKFWNYDFYLKKKTPIMQNR